MASHDWSRIYDEGAGTVKDGICIWCDAQPGTEGDCPKHPRAGARAIPRSIVDDFVGDRVAEIRKEEGRWSPLVSLASPPDGEWVIGVDPAGWPALAYATVHGGRIVSITITNCGDGYREPLESESSG